MIGELLFTVWFTDMSLIIVAVAVVISNNQVVFIIFLWRKTTIISKQYKIELINQFVILIISLNISFACLVLI